MMSNQKAPVPFSLYGSETNRPEVVLWQAVLLNQVRDLFLVRVWKNASKGQVIHKPKDCLDAERWVGSYPSQNFKLVCDLAGFDAAAVHERMSRILALPVEIRAKVNFGRFGGDQGQLWSQIQSLEEALKQDGWEEGDD